MRTADSFITVKAELKLSQGKNTGVQESRYGVTVSGGDWRKLLLDWAVKMLHGENRLTHGSYFDKVGRAIVDFPTVTRQELGESFHWEFGTIELTMTPTLTEDGVRSVEEHIALARMALAGLEDLVRPREVSIRKTGSYIKVEKEEKDVPSEDDGGYW